MIIGDEANHYRTKDGTESCAFDGERFDRWMERNKDNLAERFGQNPDIIIKHNYAERTVTITELPSKNRKQSMIDAITGGEE